jgi:hypothetical protein
LLTLETRRLRRFGTLVYCSVLSLFEFRECSGLILNKTALMLAAAFHKDVSNCKGISEELFDCSAALVKTRICKIFATEDD